MSECIVLQNNLEEMRLAFRDMLADNNCRHSEQIVALEDAVWAIDNLQKAVENLKTEGITAILT